MDFYKPILKEKKDGSAILYPDFVVARSKDLMIRGKAFYAIWDEAKGLWSTSEYDVIRLVDEELREEAERRGCTAQGLESFSNNNWKQFQSFLRSVSDNHHPLDQNLTFANTEVKKSDYVSRRLPYSLEEGDISAWDELVGTLYSVDERAKIEWTIGAIVSGDSKKIQKFLVFYGSAGTGKSTILNIVQKLFDGYTTSFEAAALGKGSAFAMESFRGDPLVAIQHDGDLSRIEDNTMLNSIISHESMSMNEKYKAKYTVRVNAFLLMGTNQPVKITDAKSGIIRRLIDVRPTGITFPAKHYQALMSKIDFELGAIAHHCLQMYREMGKNYYSAYRPTDMMFQTDIFFNFVEAHFDLFKEQDGVTLKQAYTLYKAYCEDTGITRPVPMYKMRDELTYYFEEFHDRIKIDGVDYRTYYKGFKPLQFKKSQPNNEHAYSLVLDETVSLIDELYADSPAQYSKMDSQGKEIPAGTWARTKTTLASLDTSQTHFVKIPESHIVIDFDLKDLNGTKSLERNLEAASFWPATYAEISQGGSGVHLHYAYDGDVSLLSGAYSDGVEVKTLLGDSSLRRRLTRCNNIPVASLSGGLPLKEKNVLPVDKMQSEKSVRELVKRNLRKEIHPGTKPSIDFIKKILDDAYSSGMSYDLTDMRSAIVAFAMNSTNQSLMCLKVVQQMKFVSDIQVEEPEKLERHIPKTPVIFDVEVYPNLFVVCWKFHGKTETVRMINPTPQEIENLMKLRLVGFNNRRYDNHILYARYMGYNNEQLFKLSQKMIVDKDRHAPFGEAYNVSYADVWDFMSDPSKPGLKLCGLRLGMYHVELDLPWDQPVPEDQWDRVADYCVNDVIITEAVFDDKAQDFAARQILSDISGLPVNHTTQQHTAKIIFGNTKNPQRDFVYTDLSKEFPGYKFDMGKSEYLGENPSEGGYVYAEPGMYENVAVLDVASMHPTSIIQLNVFGPYTKNFADLVEARLAVKAKEYEIAKSLLGGKLAPYLDDPETSDALAYALKIVINIVYGLTSARFDNAFRDNRNKDNIVAKRGALFMVDLKNAVQAEGFTVAHIKTDSIKVPNASLEIIEFINSFGEKYGYKFSYEGTYEKFCLVNDAVFVARLGGEWPTLEQARKDGTVKGAQFIHPYVYKTLFSGEEITFDDLCETRNVVKGTMWLDFEHDRPMSLAEGMKFVGRVGRFVPVKNGARLYRVMDDKTYAVSDTKNWLWLEADMAQTMDREDIDMSYFETKVFEAKKAISAFGNFEEFIS